MLVMPLPAIPAVESASDIVPFTAIELPVTSSVLSGEDTEPVGALLSSVIEYVLEPSRLHLSVETKVIVLTPEAYPLMSVTADVQVPTPFSAVVVNTIPLSATVVTSATTDAIPLSSEEDTERMK